MTRSANPNKTVNILGIRGIPAAHGGFETFAGHLAPYLRDRDWAVNVYCQLDPDADGNVPADFEDDWNGIHRIHLSSPLRGSSGSFLFDWRCVVDALKRPGVNLILGYNTAVFALVLRAFGRKIVMNMDGIEWKRPKWSLPVRAWFYVNEFIGVNSAHVAVADHPEIARHLRRHTRRKIEVIPYGAEAVMAPPAAAVAALGLSAGRYFVSIARIEPENSILEIVRAFSSRPRTTKLVVLGKLLEDNPYHQKVRAAASDDVMFPGAIYDQDVVKSLRFHALAYVHGHQVGGTNPSLVEALGAGSAVIGHDNAFNRWVAGEGQFYFTDEAELDGLFGELEEAGPVLINARARAVQRHADAFTLSSINSAYESVLRRLLLERASTEAIAGVAGNTALTSNSQADNVEGR